MATLIVFGHVNADGSKRSGSGFTSQRISTGFYHITFDKPFPDIPAVVASQGGNFSQPAPADGTVVGDLSTTRCGIITGTAANDQHDRQFSFIAVGDI
jgi:hypothetical protein